MRINTDVKSVETFWENDQRPESQWVDSVPSYVRKLHFMYEVVRTSSKCRWTIYRTSRECRGILQVVHKKEWRSPTAGILELFLGPENVHLSRKPAYWLSWRPKMATKLGSLGPVFYTPKKSYSKELINQLFGRIKCKLFTKIDRDLFWPYLGINLPHRAISHTSESTHDLPINQVL